MKAIRVVRLCRPPFDRLLDHPVFQMVLAGLASLSVLGADPPTQAEVRSATVEGQLDGDKARLVIQADLKGLGEGRDRAIYGATVQHTLHAGRDRLTHAFGVRIDALQGALREVGLAITGDGEVRQVTGDSLQDWAVRQVPGGGRVLVLRLKKTESLLTNVTAQVWAETLLTEFPAATNSLALTTDPATLGNGYIRLDSEPGLEVRAVDPTGLIPIEPQFLPEGMRPDAAAAAAVRAYRFQGTPYTLPVAVDVTDPEARQVSLSQFKLIARMGEGQAAFTLTATARVRNPKGGRLDLLGGGVALTEFSASPDWRLRTLEGRYVAEFDKAGEFPIRAQFHAFVRQTNGWDEVDFAVAPSALLPLSIQGLKADTQFRFAGGARPERSGEEFLAFLPPTGRMRLAWKEQRPEAEGRLFYAAEALAQVTVSPGLLRQTVRFDFKVMQGELNRVALLLRGEGEVTRVQGTAVLSWTLEPGEAGARRLWVTLNEAQKDQFTVQVQVQRPLGAFPQAAEAVRLQPEGATRFGGYLRVANEGAVRLEVLQASGLSQISPEQFPQSEATRAWLPAQSTQAFAYRFSGPEHQLRLQADNILPELTVSEVLAYHLAETELAIDAEIEIDVREAPLRELMLKVPKGYAVARLNASDLSDYFLTPGEGTESQLRLVYGNPVSGRQVVQLRLERNQPLTEPNWVLPRVDVAKAKSVRGQIGVSADAGFRLSPGATQGLTELATAFFPKKLSGIQVAFRLSDPAWQAILAVEHLPQSIHADGFHLFSVGEGIAYGSSLVNYLITGAPVATFQLELSAEYFNVEFTGKNLRSWQKTDTGYQVQLHTPVTGTYTLLATYERPFKAQGEQLTFTGARPLEVQSEQGHTVVISTYQFQVRPVNVSTSLTPLEPGEVPAEHRLLFDAPILAAYRYAARPFNLQLELKPLAQGEMISQVVDRAALATRISSEGQVVTDARYFVKNKGTPHLRLSLPTGHELWSVTVNGAAVVPVKADQANLIPLPQHADPNTVNEVQVKYASRSKRPTRVMVTAPTVAAPVLLAEWRLEPDSEHRLVYHQGTLTPSTGVVDASGFAALTAMFTGPRSGQAWGGLLVTLTLLGVAAMLWRSLARSGATRLSRRHLVSGGLALVACLVAVFTFLQLVALAPGEMASAPRDLRFLAPIQQPNSVLSLEVRNLSTQPALLPSIWSLWPAALALVVWVYGWLTSRTWFRAISPGLGWTLVFWALLRQPNGLPWFFGGAAAFLLLHVVWPGLRRWWQAPRPAMADAGGAAAATALLILAALGLEAPPARAQADAGGSLGNPASPVAERITQELRVEDEFVFGSATARWTAVKGQVLPLLDESGVLTRVDTPPDAVRVVQVRKGDRPQHLLVAEKSGPLDLKWQYQTRVVAREGERGFTLPTYPGLVNHLQLTIQGLDVDVVSPQAVSIRRDGSAAATNTVVSLVVRPVGEVWLGWKPRARDTRREKAVFFAELYQLYVPGAGVVEGQHEVQIRPAQGELNELTFEVPAGVTITDATAPLVSSWRFDPDRRRLRISLTPAQSRPFTLLIQSQIATGPLPFSQTVGLMSVAGAAGQVGLVGVATGSEVQLDAVDAEPFAPINLEDFPASVLAPLRTQVAGLTLRRAFRYADPQGNLGLKAVAVEPDVRIETQQTLSLGEDRTLLAVALEAEITRAGIFKLSFPLPPGLDVEAISGAAMSHWTELKTTNDRIVTLNLKGKTDGKQTFNVSLVGPGVKPGKAWAVPQFSVREASKQRGQLLIVPEQGMRLQAGTRDGVTQLDPLKSGVRHKGVLAFRILQMPWNLALDIEQVDAWIQVTSLQQVQVSEAQLKVAANLQYEIENTGVKSFRLHLPAAAQNVRFRGDQVSDFLPRESTGDAPAPDLKEWEVKLHRRVLGRYLLQLTYTLPIEEKAAETTVIGVRAQDVNLQRGFLTLQAGGRLQTRIDALPPTLQPTEWQVIPRALQQDIPAASANYTFRLVEADVRLPVRLERHDAARLLPARVNNVTLTSVISDDGVMLTQVRMELVPGDKRLLPLTLPPKARFWFAFVNQNSVWPWHETNQVLIPLESPSKTGEAAPVEFFYSSQTGNASSRSLDLTLAAPKFDLPLENITWRVFLSDKWKVDDWSGTLHYQGEAAAPQTAALDLQTYIQNEAALRQQKTREAEQFISLANDLLTKGDPQQARRAFQAAYGLSQHDNAFNEDARVQLHNLKLQQAVVGLNVRQARVAGEPESLAAAPRALREGATVNYTQQEAKQLIERNTAEDSAFQNRLAERIIQQQDASVATPAAIRAAIPESGRLLTFTRPLEVNTYADLRINLEASAARPSTFGSKLAALLALGVLTTGLARWVRPTARPTPAA